MSTSDESSNVVKWFSTQNRDKAPFCIRLFTWQTLPSDVTNSSMWRDKLIYVTWQTHLCDVTNLSMWRDKAMWRNKLICVTRLCSMCAISRDERIHPCATCIYDPRTHPYMSDIHIRSMREHYTHHTWHVSLIRVTWRIHIRDVWRDTLINAFAAYQARVEGPNTLLNPKPKHFLTLFPNTSSGFRPQNFAFRV